MLGIIASPLTRSEIPRNLPEYHLHRRTTSKNNSELHEDRVVKLRNASPHHVLSSGKHLSEAAYRERILLPVGMIDCLID